MTGKAELVVALSESFAACNKAFDGLTDANATEVVAGGRGPQVRVALLYGLIAHANEVYGAMGVYMVIPQTIRELLNLWEGTELHRRGRAVVGVEAGCDGIYPDWRTRRGMVKDGGLLTEFTHAPRDPANTPVCRI